MNLKNIFLAVLASTFLGQMAQAEKNELDVDLVSYMGVWKAAALKKTQFQRFCWGRTTAEYKLRADNKVAVTNRCNSVFGGIPWRIKGVAESKNETNSKLLVNFGNASRNGGETANYFIRALDPEYRWALVTGPKDETGWLLMRDPNELESFLPIIRNAFEENGLNACSFKLEPRKFKDFFRSKKLCSFWQ